ncbi:MAG: hypothetical protein WEB53_04370 [Akkermansiaceae bacterium]
MNFHPFRSIAVDRHFPSSRLLAGLLGLATATGLFAQPPLPAGTLTTAADVTFIHQFATDLDDGGDFSMSSAGFKFDLVRSLDEGRSIGWGLGYTADSYSFGGSAGLGNLDPWDTINTLGLSGSYATRLGADWDLRLSPSITASGESSASLGDSLTYGGIFAFIRKFSDTLTLGLGGGVFTGLEDTQGFPLIAVRWEFAPGWTLQNPLRPGPAGPAGLEVAYATDTWEFGVGAAFRRYRFLLADDSAVPDGFGEYTSVPLFIRASRPITSNLTLNLYGGVLLGGSIDLENSNGNGVIDSDFDPAPILALSLSGRF